MINISLTFRDENDEVAEWLRRWTANPLGSARVGSNPILVGKHFFLNLFNFIFEFDFSVTYMYYLFKKPYSLINEE